MFTTRGRWEQTCPGRSYLPPSAAHPFPGPWCSCSCGNNWLKGHVVGSQSNESFTETIKFHMIIANSSSSDSRSGSWRKILRISSASKNVKVGYSSLLIRHPWPMYPAPSASNTLNASRISLSGSFSRIFLMNHKKKSQQRHNNHSNLHMRTQNSSHSTASLPSTSTWSHTLWSQLSLSALTSLMASCSSDSVGFCPRDLITWASSWQRCVDMNVGNAILISCHICADAAVPVLVKLAEGWTEHHELLLGDAGQDGAALLLSHSIEPAPAHTATVFELCDYSNSKVWIVLYLGIVFGFVSKTRYIRYSVFNTFLEPKYIRYSWQHCCTHCDTIY